MSAIKTPKYQNTLYVSINGRNSSAKKNDTGRPWRDPWTAVAAAASGDLIYIMPGEYTIGDPASGADFEHDGTGFTYSLLKDGVGIHMESGSKITNISTVENYIFTADSGVQFEQHVTGNGEIDCGIKRMFQMTDGSSESIWNGRFRKISYDDNYCIICRRGILSFFIDVDYVVATCDNAGGVTSFLFTNAPEANPIDKAYFDVKIRDFNFDTSVYVGDFSSIITCRNTAKSFFTVNIGTISGKYRGPGYLLSGGGLQSAMTEDSIHINVGSVDLSDPYTPGTFSNFIADNALTEIGSHSTLTANKLSGMIFLYNQTTTENFVDNLIDIRIGTIRGHVGVNINSNLRPESIEENNKLSISVGTIDTELDFPAIALDLRNNPAKDTIWVVISVIGEAGSTDAPVVITSPSNSGTVFLKGRFKSTDSSIPCIRFSDNFLSDIVLMECTLITSAAGGPIIPLTSGTPKNFKIQNSFSNSLVTNVDAVEQVDLITRDSNII
jgi:hypothetical protein